MNSPEVADRGPAPVVVIGGDICPIGRVEAPLAEGGIEGVFGNLLPELRQADLAMANLECPLVACPSPAIKGGPSLSARCECAAGIRAAGFHLLGVANNHIMDHGEQGLASTLGACASVGLATVGAGANLEEAGRVFVREVRGRRIGVLAVAEAEYSIAGRNRPGAHPMDPLLVGRRLRHAREQCEFLIVLLHGGNEHLPIPRPGLRDFCRWLIEEGVRVVVCQHSHCPGTFESHRNGLAVYGQGNLLFDLPTRRNSWLEGVLVKLVLVSQDQFRHEFIPYRLKPEKDGVVRLADTAAEQFLDQLRRRSQLLASDEALEQEWAGFCRAQAGRYMSALLGFGRVLAKLNRGGWMTRLLCTRSQLRSMGNVVRCESHREVLLTLAQLRLEEEREAARDHQPRRS